MTSLKENLKNKAAADFLAAKVRKSLNNNSGVSGIDKKAASAILEMCSYSHVQKRDLDLYIKQNGQSEVVVLDASLGRYLTEADDVAMRKSPTIKEMLSFRNAKKILGDSDVLKSVKHETLSYLRNLYIDGLNLDMTPAGAEEIIKESIIELDAVDFEKFLKSLLVISEIFKLKYLPLLSKKAGFYIFGQKEQKENEPILLMLICFDNKKGDFLFFENSIKEKDLKSFFKEGKKTDDTKILKNREALVKLADIAKSESPAASADHDLFSEGIPGELSFT
ncbi:MAG: hypothetical protein ACQEQS_08615 [Thermodesulfobacteriota bacterium]